MRLYCVKNSYMAQIEGHALINIRFGYTCFGIAYPYKFWRRKRKQLLFPSFYLLEGLREATGWLNWLPHSSFEFWTHTGQCGQHWIFRFTIFNKRFGYRTKGDATPNLSTYYDAGWHLNV